MVRNRAAITQHVEAALKLVPLATLMMELRAKPAVREMSQMWSALVAEVVLAEILAKTAVGAPDVQSASDQIQRPRVVVSCAPSGNSQI